MRLCIHYLPTDQWSHSNVSLFSSEKIMLRCFPNEEDVMLTPLLAMLVISKRFTRDGRTMDERKDWKSGCISR